MRKWILFGIVAAVCGRYAEDVPGLAAGVLGGLEGVLGQMPKFAFDWSPLRMTFILVLGSLWIPGLTVATALAARRPEDPKDCNGGPSRLDCQLIGYGASCLGPVIALFVLAGGLEVVKKVAV